MILGIDLGTTKSVIGVWQNNEAHIIPDQAGCQSIPSLVLVTPDEKIFAGRIAQKHPDRYKGSNTTVSSVKRLMGRQGETGWGWWKTYPQEVSAFILAELKYQAEQYLHQQVDEVVIAIPSHFDESQRRATKEAAEIAGLTCVRLLNEATASALAYGLHRPGNQKVMVVNLGGGTLDISILDFGDGVYQVLCVEGDSKLGGDDFDQIIIDYVLHQIRQKYGTEIELDPLHRIVLKEAAERAKIDLSGMQSTSIRIPGFLRIGEEHQDLDVPIDRQTFERLSKALFDKVIEALKKALSSSLLQASDLNGLLLLGGSSRIPYVREAVTKTLGIKPFTGVDPEICVAQGAIIQAAVLDGILKESLLVDVVPLSLGLETLHGVSTRLIEKNRSIPTKQTRVFSTTEDFQKTVTVHVVQGERQMAADNVSLGRFNLVDIPPAPKGVPQIEVTFDVDQNGILNVTAKDLGTGKVQEITVTSPYGLNATQIRAMRERLNSWLSDRPALEIRSQADSLRAHIQELLSKNLAPLGWAEITQLKEGSASLGKLIENRGPCKSLEDTISWLQPIYHKAQEKTSAYQSAVKSIDYLIAKIDAFSATGKQADEKQAKLLNEGRQVLQEYRDRCLSSEELRKTYSSIRSAYEDAKAKAIRERLEALQDSEEMLNWLLKAKTNLSGLSPMRQHLSRLRELKEASSIRVLLESEDDEYRQSIQLRLSQKISDEPCLRAYFILIAGDILTLDMMPTVGQLVHDQKTAPVLAYVAFDALRADTARERRRTAAQLIATYFLDSRYLGIVCDAINDEPDNIVRRHLLDYVDKQPPGTFHALFANADPQTRSRISANREALLRLAKEDDEESRMFALESLARLSPGEAVPVFLSFVNSMNRDIAGKALQLVLQANQGKDTRLIEFFARALHDPSPEMRWLALEFLEQARETSCLPHVVSLLHSEQDETVREKAVSTLGKLKLVKAIPHLLRLLMDENEKVRALARSSLTANLELMESDVNRLSNLIIKVTQQNRSLGIMDAMFLRRVVGRHPEMNEVARTLREMNAKRV